MEMVVRFYLEMLVWAVMNALPFFFFCSTFSCRTKTLLRIAQKCVLKCETIKVLMEPNILGEKPPTHH